MFHYSLLTSKKLDIPLIKLQSLKFGIRLVREVAREWLQVVFVVCLACY